MGLLIIFGRGFRAEFWWWIVVGLVWWAVGCGGTVGLGAKFGGFAWWIRWVCLVFHMVAL